MDSLVDIRLDANRFMAQRDQPAILAREARGLTFMAVECALVFSVVLIADAFGLSLAPSNEFVAFALSGVL